MPSGPSCMAAAQPPKAATLEFQLWAAVTDVSHDWSVGTSMVRPSLSLIESTPMRPAGLRLSVVLVAATAIRFAPDFRAEAMFMT